MKIIVTKNYQTMSELAAELVIKQIEKKSNSVLGLATGNTTESLYFELVKAYKNKQVTFNRVRTFNLDEYYGLGPSDKQSYHFQMLENLFKHVDLKPENIYLPDGRATDYKKECRDYELAIKRCLGIDLLILGIGHNGHIGFNEPGTSHGSKTHLGELSLSTRRANAKYFDGNLKKVPKSAVTMGIATIMSAKKIIFLASGKNKADIVAKALQGRTSGKVPASVLRKHRSLIIILDEAAASKIHTL